MQRFLLSHIQKIRKVFGTSPTKVCGSGNTEEEEEEREQEEKEEGLRHAIL